MMLVLLLIALLIFVLGAANVNWGVNLVSLGLAILVLAWILERGSL